VAPRSRWCKSPGAALDEALAELGADADGGVVVIIEPIEPIRREAGAAVQGGDSLRPPKET